jgi:hypothetical protein
MDVPPALLTSALEKGEKLIWWDQPQGGIVFRAIDGFLIPFSIVWVSIPAAGAITTLRGASAVSPQSFMVVPFLAIGAYILVGRFLYDAWRRGRTVYGLTDQRALILRPSKQISITLDHISEMSLQERGSGRGSIVFGPSGINRQNASGVWGGDPAVPTFEFIPDARNVYAAIRNAQKKARSD